MISRVERPLTNMLGHLMNQLTSPNFCSPEEYQGGASGPQMSAFVPTAARLSRQQDTYLTADAAEVLYSWFAFNLCWC